MRGARLRVEVCHVGAAHGAASGPGERRGALCRLGGRVARRGEAALDVGLPVGKRERGPALMADEAPVAAAGADGQFHSACRARARVSRACARVVGAVRTASPPPAHPRRRARSPARRHPPPLSDPAPWNPALPERRRHRVAAQLRTLARQSQTRWLSGARTERGREKQVRQPRLHTSAYPRSRECRSSTRCAKAHHPRGLSSQ